MATSNTRTRKSQAQEPEAPAAPAENPRTVKSREKLAFACAEIEKLLAKGEWVSSNEIHRALQGKIAEGMFGRAKASLGIEHRRVKGENGKAIYEWKLPAKKK